MLKGAIQGGLYVKGGEVPFGGNKPLVSALIYCRNGGETLERALQSIFQQDYENIEIIVADGNSTDNTVDILEKYNDRIHYWRSEPDSCASDGQNKVLSWFNGDYFYFVNSDDWINQDYTSNSVYFMLSHEIDFVMGDCSIYNDGKFYKISRGNEKYEKLMYRYHSVTTVSVFYTKNFYDVCGLVDCSYKTASDYEWFLRAIERGLKGGYTPDLHVHMDFGGRSAPHRWRDAWALIWRAEEWHIQILYGVHPMRASWNYALEVARALVSRSLVSLGLSAVRGWLPQSLRR
jgi:glycosyltransferase involved in cell wall biosynthesis